MINTTEELGWGLSDIAIFIAAFIFAWLLAKKNSGSDRKRWIDVFVFFGIAGVLGTVVHTFAFTDVQAKWIWVVQFALLYNSARLFHLCFLNYLDKNHPTEKESAFFNLLTLILYVLTVILNLILPKYQDALYVFIGYAAMAMIPLIVLTFFKGKQNKDAKLLFGMLILSLLSQGLSFLNGIGVVFGHAFDVAALFLGYRIAKSDE